MLGSQQSKHVSLHLKNNNNSSNNGNVSKKEDHDQEYQRSTGAVATGFNTELSEEGAMKFLRHFVREVDMKLRRKIILPSKTDHTCIPPKRDNT